LHLPIYFFHITYVKIYFSKIYTTKYIYMLILILTTIL
jgi:hypothetical protein